MIEGRGGGEGGRVGGREGGKQGRTDGEREGEGERVEECGGDEVMRKRRRELGQMGQIERC